jgi:glycosyltransferase involved in cell wall biosynthesis
MHICHFTSAHARFDSRIFEKMCRSISQYGYRVTLIVADGLGNEIIDNVNIVDVGRNSGRLNRMLKTTILIWKSCLKIDADIFHFHDPELLFVGLYLKKTGKHVVFDSHEDYVGTLLIKPYLKFPFNRILSILYYVIERSVCIRLDGVVGATPQITGQFTTKSKKTININNYPILEKADVDISWAHKQIEVCYVGSIAYNRGVKEIVTAMSFVKTNVRLNLVGNYNQGNLENELKSVVSFSKINEFGYLSKLEVKKIYKRSMVGIITLLPLPTYLESLPIKMFEYMAAGLPFIASDFPFWRKLLDGHDCCIFVDPLNPQAIAEAVDYLILNPELAQQMGDKGRDLVYRKYDWKYESEELLNFYSSIAISQ